MLFLADVTEEQPREEVYYSNNEQISQPNSEIEEVGCYNINLHIVAYRQ